MYELIWSNFHSAHIIRRVCTSTIVPLFMGTLEECTHFAMHHTSGHLTIV